MLASGQAHAVAWSRVGVVTTLTNGQLCRTDGTYIICDTSDPTISGGLVGIGSTIPRTSLDLSQETDALMLPIGTTGSRPAAGVNGMIRYNTSVAGVEAYINGSWQSLQSASGTWTGGTITVPYGGTGDTTLTAHGLLVGNGTGAVSVTAAGAAGTVLIGQGASADPIFSPSPSLTNLTLSGFETDSFGTAYSTTGAHADVALNTASTYSYTGASAGTVQGIVAGASGQRLTLHNDSTSTLTLSNLSGSEATAANKIITGTGADIVLPANSAVTLQYDATANSAAGAWTVTGSSNASNTAISGLTAATATDGFDNGTYAQTWTWNTLAGNAALSLSSTSTAAAANGQELLNLALSGANSTASQTTYDAYFTNTHTGSTSTNVGLYASASGATNNYAAIFANGNVGIGTTIPSNALQISGSNQLAILGDQGNATAYFGVSAFGGTNTTGRAIFGYDSGNNNAFIQGYGKGIEFSVAASAPPGAASVVISSGGLVGIGTASPADELTIYTPTTTGKVDALDIVGNIGSGGNNYPRLRIDNINAGSYKSSLGFGNGAASPRWELGIDAGGAGAQNFFIYDNVAAQTRVYIDNNGNVGIGTTLIGSPLQVNGGAAIGYSTSTAAPTNGMIVVGSVGIGTASPGYPLDVSGDIETASGSYRMHGSGVLSSVGSALTVGPSTAWTTINYGNASTAYQIFQYGSVGIGTTSPNVPLGFATATGDKIRLYDNPSGGSQFGFGVYSGELRTFSGNSSVTTFGNQISATFTERMRLDASGNLGIGTNSPGSALQVNGGAAVGYSTNTAAPTNGLAVSGTVGVGTATVPTGITESVNGVVKVAGTGSEACSASTIGAVRYNPSGQYMEICTYP